MLDLWSGDLLIGNATIKDLVIKPGNHTYPLRGILDIKTVMQNLQQVIASQRDALRNGNIALKSTGNLVTYEGVTVDYYTRIMKNLTLTAQIPVMQVLQNTLHDLFHFNGTNPLASLNLTDSANDIGGSSNLLDSLNNGGAVKKLMERGSTNLLEALNDPEELRRLIESYGNA